jgi:hypothetical protein
MTEWPCTYGDTRDDAIVAYLYADSDASDGNPAERARFETHLATCARCQAEIASLRGVRRQLSHWSPPDFASFHLQSAVSNLPWWRSIPVWAQVAAALLFLGVSAGIANLDVHYDQSGLTVRTGWSKPVAVAQSSTTAGTPWKADIAALESQLKTEMRTLQRTASSSTAAPAVAVRTVSATAPSDAEVTRRVRALLEESEKRQQRELALRIAELLRDVSAQRQADLVKIDRTLGAVQNNVGIEVMKNRQQLNQMDLLYRASQRQ